MEQNGKDPLCRFVPRATQSTKGKKTCRKRITVGLRARAMSVLESAGRVGRASPVALPAGRSAELRIQSVERPTFAQAPAQLP